MALRKQSGGLFLAATAAAMPRGHLSGVQKSHESISFRGILCKDKTDYLFEANECAAAGGRIRLTNEVKKQGVLRSAPSKQDDYVSEVRSLYEYKKSIPINTYRDTEIIEVIISLRTEVHDERP